MPSRTGRVAAVLAAGIVAVAAVAWALWRIVAPEVLEQRIVAALEAQGIGVERLEVTALTTTRARIERIVLSGPIAPRIGKVEAVYDILDLLERRRVERVEITDASITMLVDSDGRIEVAGFPAGSRSEAGGVPELPVDQFTVRDSRVRLDTPWLDADVPVTAVAEVIDDGSVAIEGEAFPTTAIGEASLRFDASLGRDGKFAAGVDVASAKTSVEALSINGVEGWLAIEGGPGRETVLDAQITAAKVGTRSAELTDTVIQFGLIDRNGWALIRADLNGSDGALRIDAGLDDGMVDLGVSIETEDLGSIAAPFARPGTVFGRGVLLMSGRADLDAGLREKRLVLFGTTPWQASATIAAIGPAKLEMPGPGQQLTVSWTQDLTASLAGSYAIDVGPMSASGVVDASVTASGRRPISFAVDRLTLAGKPVDVLGASVAVKALKLTGQGAAGTFEGRLEATITSDESGAGEITVEDGVVAGAGDVSYADGTVRFGPDDCLSVKADAITAGGAAVLERIDLCMAPRPNTEFLTARFDAPDGPTVAVGFTTRAAPVGLEFLGAGMPDVTEAGLPSLSFDAAFSAGNGLVLKGNAEGGHLALTGPGVAVSGIGGTFALDPGADPAGVVEWQAAEVRLLGDPPPVVPLRLSGTARTTADGLAFAGKGVGALGGVMLGFDGRHGFGRGGEVTFRLDPVSFAPGVRQPADVFPALSALALEAVIGVGTATGRYGWGDLSGSGAKVGLQNLSFQTPFMVVSGASADLRADGLLPLTLPPGQRLSVEELDIGIPLKNGAATFGMTGDGRFSVTHLSFEWAGGSLGAEPFAMSWSDPDRAIVLRADDVDLAELMAAIPVDGLQVTGRLDGRVPIRLGNDMIAIDDAVLKTTGPGVIRYAPEAPPRVRQGEDSSLNLLLEALRNFHYESVTVTLNGRTGRDMEARMEIRGANPDLYGGYPISLNVNVSGALDRILRQGLAAASYAEQVEDFYRERLRHGVTEDFLDGIEDIQQ